MSLPYFLYVSNQKVDSLLPFAKNKRDKLPTEIKVDLKVLSFTWQSESTPGARWLPRLQRVIRCLKEVGDLGTVDEPRSYFCGVLPMRWGPFGEDVGTSLVFFTGQAGCTVIGLGGSAVNVVGASAPPADGEAMPRSLLPGLLDGLRTRPELAELLDKDDDCPACDYSPANANRPALAAVHQAAASARGPVQHVEFVAKRLLHGPSPLGDAERSPEMSVLLGSPLYVALVD